MEDKDLSFESIPIEYLQAFKDMWNDGGIQKTFEQGNEYALYDNLG
jgi:guanine nucleotide-binding protein subunit alpha